MGRAVLAGVLVLGAACGTAQGGQRIAEPTIPPTTAAELTSPATTAPEPTTAEVATTLPAVTTTEYLQPVATTAPVPRPSSTLASIRACESGADYSADTGNGFYGAYQFTISTWASVGGVGNPALASPFEQDMRAQVMIDAGRRGEWPNC